MQLRNLLLLAVLASSMIACSATRQPQSAAADPNNEKFEMRGFSLSIPAHEGWNVAKKEPFKIVLAKQGAGKNERYAIQALVVELPKFKDDKHFLEYIESRMQKNNDKSSAKAVDVKSHLIAGQGEMCVQSHSKQEISAPSALPNTAKGILEIVNFTCRSPDRKNAGIYLAYSRRSLDGNTDNNLAAEANKVFSNLQFTDI